MSETCLLSIQNPTPNQLDSEHLPNTLVVKSQNTLPDKRSLENQSARLLSNDFRSDPYRAQDQYPIQQTATISLDPTLHHEFAVPTLPSQFVEVAGHLKTQHSVDDEIPPSRQRDSLPSTTPSLLPKNQKQVHP